MKQVPEVPSPYGPLSSSLSPTVIKDANTAVKQCIDLHSQATAKPRGTYAKFTPENQAAIAKYAFLHGNKAAICHFSKNLERKLRTALSAHGKKSIQLSLNVL